MGTKHRLIGLVAGALVLGACGGNGSAGSSPASADSRPLVLASFYPIAEMAERVGAGVVRVENLTAAGTEPHDLELSPDQVAGTESAELLLYTGNGFAPAIESAAERRSGPSVDVSAGLPLVNGKGEGEAEGHDHDHGSGREINSVDPHFWLDPTLLGAATAKVETALTQLVPQRADDIRSNAERYRLELAKLDGDYRAGLASCASKTIVTSHAAFGYLAARYGLEQHAIVLAPDAEPNPKQMDELVDVIKTEKVTTVFSEALVSTKVADALAREASVQTAVLNPIEGLTDQQLSAKAGYDSVMRENLVSLRKALSCV